MMRRTGSTLVAAFLLVAVTLAVYMPAMQGGFIWDDDHMVTNNRFIRAPDGLYHFWLTTKPEDYFPLTSTMLWIEWRLWGMDPTGYHVVNVLLHALSAVVIWRVLRRLGVPGACVAAAIFAVHPVAAESVAWIAERKNTLSMLLFVLSMLAYLRFEDSSRRGWYTAALATFLLALLAKTSVVMMPVVVLVLAWWRRGRINKTDVLRTLPFFALSFALGLVTVCFEHQHLIGREAVRPGGLLSRLAGSGWCAWFYLYKALLPIRLAMIYPLWKVDATLLLAWCPLLALGTMAVAAWRHRSTWGRAVLAALGYFVAMLLPVLGLLHQGYFRLSLVADHLQYVALIGPIALLVAASTVLLRRWQAGRRVAKAAAMVVLAALFGLTWQKAGLYEDQETLWRDTLQKNPDAWMGHHNLGTVVQAQGRLDEAIRSYLQALKLNPDYAEAHYNLGNALGSQGKLDEAIRSYLRALKLKPDLAAAHYNLGSAFVSQGKLDEAVSSYLQALKLEPDFAEAHCNLGNALALQGKLDEAIRQYDQALRLKPDDAEAHYNLGNAVQSQGKVNEAIRHYRRALQSKPGWPALLNNMAWILATHPDAGVREPDEAVRLAERASELTRYRDPAILDTLAAAYAATGQFDRALAIAQDAHKVAVATGADDLAEAIRQRLELYEQNKPYRELPSTSTRGAKQP